MSKFLLFLLVPVFISVAPFSWLTPMEHDFGDIEQGEYVTCYFEFKNTSDEAFLIDNVRTSCGCTAPDWTYEPIQPDSTSVIKLVFDAKKEGYFRKKITVFFSNQRKGEKLYVEGTVLEKEE